MLSIDPDLVADAVIVLRATATSADDIRHDGVAGGQAANMTVPSLMLVRDLEDDLTLLSSILTARAAHAMGFQIDATRLLSDMDSLLSSIHIEGDLAIYAAIADGKVTDAEWENLDLKGFARYTTIEDFKAYLQENEDLRSLEPIMREMALESDQGWGVFELMHRLLDEYPEQSEQIRRVFTIDSSVYTGFGISSFTTPDQLLAEAISRGIYNHSPANALDFFMGLPNVENRGYGIDIFAIDSADLAATYEVANRMSTNFDDEVVLLLHIPETEDGFRNHRLNVAYGQQSAILEGYVDPAIGTNWAAFAASASYTVGFALDGSDSVLRQHNPPIKRNDFANGNQTIAMSVLPHYLRLNHLFENGEPSEAEIEAFLREFGDGEAELRAGFHRQIRAATADTLEVAQKLQFEANVLIGVHEQTLIEGFLDFGRMGEVLEFGTQLVTAIDGVVEHFTDSEDPSAGFRNAGEYLAEEGNLRVLNADGTEHLIPLGQMDDADNYTLDALEGIRLDDLDLSLDIPGLHHITTVGEETGRELKTDEWNQDITGSIDLDDYTKLNERLPVIMSIFARGSGDPRIRDGAAVIAKSDPDDLGVNRKEAKPTE